MSENNHTRQQFFQTAAKAAMGLAAFVPAIKLLSDVPVAHAESRVSRGANIIRPDYENCDCTIARSAGQCFDGSSFSCSAVGLSTLENVTNHVDCHNTYLICSTTYSKAACINPLSEPGYHSCPGS